MTTSTAPETWRQFLAMRISDLDERRRIAQLAGVDEVTLKRYAEGKTKRIRPHLLRPLVDAWPSGERPLLTRLILEEFPDWSWALRLNSSIQDLIQWGSKSSSSNV